MLQEVNEKTTKEILEKNRMEKIINANTEHLKLINRILRHDITNDLVTIKSGLSVYQVNGDKAILDELTRRVDKSVKLIHSMREFEKFMNIHINLKAIDPVALISNIAENYQTIEIKLTGKCHVMAEDSLSSALENLIRNAVDHGGVNQIDVAIEEMEENCRIIVADKGYGIPDSIKDKVFTEGFRYGSTGKTGMGLFIARKIIESFGGKLTIEDNVPQGTRFIILLRKAI
jgi:signal transduction histidine kinase